MRCSTIFFNLVTRNAKVRISKEIEDDLKVTNNNFWYTLDCINSRNRDEFILANGENVSRYRIPGFLSSLVFPSALTVTPGLKYTDYLDRGFKFSEDDVKGTLLSPVAFEEAIIYLFNVDRITLKTEDFSEIKIEERTISTSEADFYMCNGMTTAVDTTEFPMPVTLDFVTRRYMIMPVDDDFVSEWMKANVFNKLLTKSNS